jgi:hypothetical protein
MHTDLQREIRGGMTRVEAAVDALHGVLDPGTDAPSPVVPKKRTSTRLKNPSKKAKDSGGQSEQIRNPLLDEDERLEVESHHGGEEDL